MNLTMRCTGKPVSAALGRQGMNGIMSITALKREFERSFMSAPGCLADVPPQIADDRFGRLGGKNDCQKALERRLG